MSDQPPDLIDVHNREAGVELGLPSNPDFNGAEPDGVGFYQVTQRRGARHSSGAAYPGSRGRISLRSADPFAAPVIEPASLATGADLRMLVDGVTLARRLARTAALAPFRGAEVWPGAEVDGDPAIADFVRRRAQTRYHPVGTCRMGAGSMAVVDGRLRVSGVEGLRVVDASVMPAIVGGNTNAPTIMLAERAADWIRQGA